MQNVFATLVEQAQAFTMLELIAVLLSVGYVILAIRQNIWCWLCAGISTAIFAYLFFVVHLYMESVLNVFYFFMAMYGWQSWHYGRRDSQQLPVVIWSHKVHLAAIVIVCLLSWLSGYFLDTQTDAAFPYVDSLTSWGAIWATYLVARKVLENWWYWLLIDATMIYVFWAKDLELTAVLYMFYVLLIPMGIVSWTRSYRETRT